MFVRPPPSTELFPPHRYSLFEDLFVLYFRNPILLLCVCIQSFSFSSPRFYGDLRRGFGSLSRSVLPLASVGLLLLVLLSRNLLKLDIFNHFHPSFFLLVLSEDPWFPFTCMIRRSDLPVLSPVVLTVFSSRMNFRTCLNPLQNRRTHPFLSFFTRLFVSLDDPPPSGLSRITN